MMKTFFCFFGGHTPITVFHAEKKQIRDVFQQSVSFVTMRTRVWKHLCQNFPGSCPYFQRLCPNFRQIRTFGGALALAYPVPVRYIIAYSITRVTCRKWSWLHIRARLKTEFGRGFATTSRKDNVILIWQGLITSVFNLFLKGYQINIGNSVVREESLAAVLMKWNKHLTYRTSILQQTPDCCNLTQFYVLGQFTMYETKLKTRKSFQSTLVCFGFDSNCVPFWGERMNERK